MMWSTSGLRGWALFPHAMGLWHRGQLVMPARRSRARTRRARLSHLVVPVREVAIHSPGGLLPLYPLGMEPLAVFTSHIGGKNAQVAVFPDRVEWAWRGWLGTGAKAGLAVATMGMSYAATGVRGKRGQEVIPVRAITYVSRRTHRLQDLVVVGSSAGEVEMRVSRAEADWLVPTLTALSQGVHPSQQPQVQQVAPWEAQRPIGY